MTRFPNGVSSFIYTLGSILGLPASTVATRATISGGRILLLSVAGVVTTAVQNQLNNTKFIANPTTGADVDLCAVADIANLAVGTQITITGTLATALQINASGVQLLTAAPIIIPVGTIEISCSATNTGALQLTWLWTPIDPAGKLVAA